MRGSFIVPLQSSHSLNRYGGSVLTERAPIATLDRSSDPLLSFRACACLHVCARPTDTWDREVAKSLLLAGSQSGLTSNTENANRWVSWLTIGLGFGRTWPPPAATSGWAFDAANENSTRPTEVSRGALRWRSRWPSRERKQARSSIGEHPCNVMFSSYKLKEIVQSNTSTRRFLRDAPRAMTITFRAYK